MSVTPHALDVLCIDTIRLLGADMAQKANSGHPGMAMGAAPMAYVLWNEFLKHDPGDPTWPDRDRFVLSAGHGSALLYSLLHLTGYDLTLDDLKAFRQWGSMTPGHPESSLSPGGEATTGPLGQGCTNAVGMAIAERMLAHRFNRPGHSIVDHFTFALVSDGDMMEGVSAEAGSLASQLRLGKLIYLYDSNNVTLDGPTSISFDAENVGKRYEAYGWHVQHVDDGNCDLESLREAIRAAKADTTRPSLIVVKTTIGYGSPNRCGTSACHGAPLGPEEVALAKKGFGFDPEKHFNIPDDVGRHLRNARAHGAKEHSDWSARWEAWAKEFPQLAEEWRQAQALALPAGWDAELPQFSPGDDQPTRNSGGTVLNAIAKRVPWLVGGDADIGSSTKSEIKGGGWFDGQTGAGRNIHFGVREHAMAAIANGLSYHGGVRPMVSTFFTFVDYMRPAVRLAAISHLPVIYYFSHDSLAVGEDGPTHQPVEQLAALRLMPNVTVLRPADANETAEAWRWTMQHLTGPVAILTTRQNVPVIDRSRYAPSSGLAQGAYLLADAVGGEPEVVVIASGSEVALALAAHEALATEGLRTRVVSMPSWELFQKQSKEYRDQVLPPHIQARVAVEAGVSFGWERWVGTHGVVVSVDRYGASAPGDVTMQKLGFTVDNVVRAIRRAHTQDEPIEDMASSPGDL